MWKKVSRFATLALSLAGICAGTVTGGIVVEAELDGTATNNSLASAEFLDDADFTTDLTATVFAIARSRTATIHGRGGELDVDFYRFSLEGRRTTLLFDIDDDPFSVDTMLTLFDATGTMIGFDDDSFPEDAGTAFLGDSFLGRLTLNRGVYYIAVSEFPNYPIALTDPFIVGLPLDRPDGEFGGNAVFNAAVGESGFLSTGVQPGVEYTLYITQAVPEPAGLQLLGIGCAVLALTRWLRS